MKREIISEMIGCIDISFIQEALDFDGARADKPKLNVRRLFNRLALTACFCLVTYVGIKVGVYFYDAVPSNTSGSVSQSTLGTSIGGNEMDDGLTQISIKDYYQPTKFASFAKLKINKIYDGAYTEHFSTQRWKCILIECTVEEDYYNKLEQGTVVILPVSLEPMFDSDYQYVGDKINEDSLREFFLNYEYIFSYIPRVYDYDKSLYSVSNDTAVEFKSLCAYMDLKLYRIIPIKENKVDLQSLEEILEQNGGGTYHRYYNIPDYQDVIDHGMSVDVASDNIKDLFRELKGNELEANSLSINELYELTELSSFVRLKINKIYDGIYTASTEKNGKYILMECIVAKDDYYGKLSSGTVVVLPISLEPIFDSGGKYIGDKIDEAQLRKLLSNYEYLISYIPRVYDTEQSLYSENSGENVNFENLCADVKLHLYNVIPIKDEKVDLLSLDNFLEQSSIDYLKYCYIFDFQNVIDNEMHIDQVSYNITEFYNQLK